MKMLISAIKEKADLFIKKSENQVINIISHFDTDGITSAAIIAKALKRIDKPFTIKILKQLESENFNQFPKKGILLFLDLGSSNLEEISKLQVPTFIIDHHEITSKVPENIEIINPHLINNEEVSAAGLSYLFAKSMNEKNIDLANLAVIGMVGDMLDQDLSKTNNQILKDAEVIIKKGLLVYPSTRPINKTLEFSSNIFIPGVTGCSKGVLSLIKEAKIEKINNTFKSLIELSDEEMSNLITAVMLRTMKNTKQQDIIGNIYLLKVLNRLEDARELSAMINACSRLGTSDTAFALCLGSKKARSKAEEIYATYKQHIISALNNLSHLKKIEGREYIIINAENEIKDTIIGTVASILSSSPLYEKGTIIIAMAYTKEKIRVSARIVGREGKNVREILSSVIKEIGGEVGGHPKAAGCLISREKEDQFLDVLKKRLDIELVKV